MPPPVTAGDEHVEQRPGWDCLACERPWPCDTAREQLATELSATSLRIHMWTRLEVAAGDLRATLVGELFDRFLRWTCTVPTPHGPRC